MTDESRVMRNWAAASTARTTPLPVAVADCVDLVAIAGA